MRTNPDRNSSHLSGEYFVAAELYRRGYSVAITLGNAKAIDLFAERKTGKRGQENGKQGQATIVDSPSREAEKEGMPRSIRLEYPGAFYHVMARGNRRESIYRDEKDRRFFLKTLGEACGMTGWRVHAWVLLRNPLPPADRNPGTEPRGRDAVAAKHLHPALQRAAPALGPALW